METMEERRKRLAANTREYRIAHKHPCLDCGKPCDARRKRCNSCAHKGQLAYNWKGGRQKTSYGYIVKYSPNHPRANKRGYVREHILVWEETHGKPLPKGWIVHHLNGIKDDNCPKNLVGFPNKKHYLILQAKAKRIQELEALLNNQNQLL